MEKEIVFKELKVLKNWKKFIRNDENVLPFTCFEICYSCCGSCEGEWISWKVSVSMTQNANLIACCCCSSCEGDGISWKIPESASVCRIISFKALM